MFLQPRSKQRPFHLGPFPLESLPRDPGIVARETTRPAPGRTAAPPAVSSALARVVAGYRSLFGGFATGEPAPALAPLPDHPERRAADAKGAAYFMDASQVGICRIPERAWRPDAMLREHDHAVVMLVEHPRVPETTNLAHEWCRNAAEATADMRATEIAAILAGHLRNMGVRAAVHAAGESGLDLDRLAVLAGLAVRRGGHVVNPFLGRDYAVAAVSTDYRLPPDEPLAANALSCETLAYWWGISGATSGRERYRRATRATHLSRYPMETIRRAARPTTLIVDDEVPRVSKRAAFFERALKGDLGRKSQVERGRFAFKHPMSMSQLGIIRSMVPHQDGPIAPLGEACATRHRDPAANARAIKSLSYFLGADLTGICEIPRYAWDSHHEDGRPIEPYHRYAVVMLIDQGYDTMEGASGDDWMSGAQSMRGYLRGAEVAGIMAEHLRGLGFPARSQTNADSDVQHIPLLLWAGLGELSRIGELVLNPFVGPRFKSVVLTTDLPLEPDQPIDFGLQAFCERCFKCARECPCDAIPYGDKVVFNGYEIWKPDVERCTRYRLTNAKGSACGRCMKTCPLNKVVDRDGAVLTRIASWLGVNAMWAKPVLVPLAARLDDLLGNGRRNPRKKWWFDHEMVDGVAVSPKATNEREIDPGRAFDATKQKIAYYPASVMPPPDSAGPVTLDRKVALTMSDALETPAGARARVMRGEVGPDHYRPIEAIGERRVANAAPTSPYRSDAD